MMIKMNQGFSVLALAIVALITVAPRAEDAGELREKGIAALKESQANPRAIVEAARNFAKAAAAYGAAGNEEKSVEMNSFLYWCKKKMTLEDIEVFTKGGEGAVAERLTAVEKIAPKVDEAQKWLERAEKFAAGNPNEHLLIAVRFYEVADRFQGSKESLKAQDRSLKEQMLDKNSAAASALPAKPHNEAPAEKKRTLPKAEELKSAEKLARDLFKAEFAKTDAAARLALFEKLIQQASENKADVAAEYVLLREARDLAVLAGDANRAVLAHTRMGKTFELKAAQTLAELNMVEPQAHAPEAAGALALVVVSAANDAVEENDFDAAGKLISRADDLARLSKNVDVVTTVKNANTRVTALRREGVAAAAAAKILSTKPDDAAANVTVGKFALMREDFEKAFALLAKGSDAGLSGLAKGELAAQTDATAQASLGDGWYDRSEKETGMLKATMQERACLWYTKALPGLSGLAKLKVETRLKNNQLRPNAAIDASLKKTMAFDIGKGIKLEVVLIPPGTFQMGDDAKPITKAHTVSISKAFYLGKYEVTQEQYTVLMGTNPSHFRGATLPVDNVNYDEALAFCEKLNALIAKDKVPLGMIFRLPTEAQWEYSCRAGTKTMFYTGDQLTDLDKAGWWGKNGQGTTHPVGQKEKNAFGLYDMHGNVWEWCLDFRIDNYESLAAIDPFNATGDKALMRGGAYKTEPGYSCGSTMRIFNPRDLRYQNFGFRVALAGAAGK